MMRSFAPRLAKLAQSTAVRGFASAADVLSTRLAFAKDTLSNDEAAYAYTLSRFGQHFLAGPTPEYMRVKEGLEAANEPELISELTTMRRNMQRNLFTEETIHNVLTKNAEVVKMLYADFAAAHEQGKTVDGEAVCDVIKAVPSEFDREVLSLFANFNKNVLKTNFYKADKSAVSFRLNPEFLPVPAEFPDTPFGVFFVVGDNFRGFHVRFKDIARGGIRVIKSRDGDAFAQNMSYQFNENYDLAHTQQRKNKDIPEGGSKGTVLLDLDSQEEGPEAFKAYINSILDIILPNMGIHDHYGQPEILFFGPDENTADVMDWAVEQCTARDYSVAKAVTTGKGKQLGGIPHDCYGMTTRSVRECVRGVEREMKFEQTKMMKFMTGGPDGDLGSNEILLSEHPVNGIVDGSGTLYDPEGLDREELIRLANERLMVEHFNKDKLTKDGFFVHVNDTNVTLPDGEFVADGAHLRNTFHLNPKAAADVFVPCGGRPQAVNGGNWEQLLDAQGNPKFKYLCEGANLFVTQEARLLLEAKGMILLKDATANKGGVTSSSMEVFAALSMTDAQFDENMRVVDPANEPTFYQNYVKDVIAKVEGFAAAEFDCVWKENAKTGTPMTIVSDLLSNKINQTNDAIQESDLWEDMALRRKVITEHCPKTLVDLVGIDQVMERVPEAYQKAIFGCMLASKFVYANGLNAPEVEFYNFVKNYTA